MHVSKGHIHESEVDKLFAMGFKGQKKRGPTRKNKDGMQSKGRWKRWCPETGCSYLGAYLSHHLQNKHHLKPTSSKYKTALKIAPQYKGIYEELKMMTSPKKRPPSDESDNEVIPPTPPKKKCLEKEPAEDIAVAGPSCTEADQQESKDSPRVDDDSEVCA